MWNLEERIKYLEKQNNDLIDVINSLEIRLNSLEIKNRILNNRLDNMLNNED